MAAKVKQAPPSNASEGGNGTTAVERRPKSNLKYPPYVGAYGSIPRLFSAIKAASVPPKFTQDFMETVLGMKSSSHRALIPLLKRLDFLDAANVPTDTYRKYRDESQSRTVMADTVRTAYAILFREHEYAYKFSDNELGSKLRAIIGAAENDVNVDRIVGTFSELKKLAEFDGAASMVVAPERQGDDVHEGNARPIRSATGQLGISYTINLNLPATTEIAVFNAIFKSLREHILDGN